MRRSKGKLKKIFRRALGYTLAVLLIGSLSLSSCNKQSPSATDLMALLLAELDHPDMTLYFESAPKEGEGWLSEEKLTALYGGHSTSILAEKYAIALCKDDRIYEIHLYYALNATAASQIEELLRGRLEELQQKENYLYDADSLASSGNVWRKGNWVCLLVTENNAKAKAIIKDRL